ncbi:hypothetical protein CES85_2093 [Ochrobactrum quorumnocens]|uniref:Uncharacterized protein n=1 Tax=Ochrobactrum quorumnocens TaxID=271865 RepID=A0A248UGG7_9HYPH|nr:hypothetical protein CES85_2093 [[Ochrobactrum] quorumnocens]
MFLTPRHLKTIGELSNLRKNSHSFALFGMRFGCDETCDA